MVCCIVCSLICILYTENHKMMFTIFKTLGTSGLCVGVILHMTHFWEGVVEMLFCSEYCVQNKFSVCNIIVSGLYFGFRFLTHV